MKKKKNTVKRRCELNVGRYWLTGLIDLERNAFLLASMKEISQVYFSPVSVMAVSKYYCFETQHTARAPQYDIDAQEKKMKGTVSLPRRCATDYSVERTLSGLNWLLSWQWGFHAFEHRIRNVTDYTEVSRRRKNNNNKKQVNWFECDR